MTRPPQLDRIYTGDAKRVLARWPSDFVDLCLTSPPYFQLRDYEVTGQVGLETRVEEYVARLVDVLEEVRRVLKPTGSVYLNLGDTYRQKSLLGTPWRVASALRERGWLIRNAVVWHKPWGRPSPATDRLTNRYEVIFHLVRQKDYFFDLNAIRIPAKHPQRRRSRPPVRGPWARPKAKPHAGGFASHPLGKNPGDVWSIGPETRPKRYIVPGAETVHFAPFPEALCERPILAASPQGGIVLDPFMGSGTTALVAQRLGRRYLGVELSRDYAALARRRIRGSGRSRCRRPLPTSSRRGTRSRPPTCKNRPSSAPSVRPS